MQPAPSSSLRTSELSFRSAARSVTVTGECEPRRPRPSGKSRTRGRSKRSASRLNVSTMLILYRPVTGLLLCAIRTLGHIGDARAVAPLCRKLLGVDPADRRAAASALGNIGGAKAVDALCAALNYPPERRDHFSSDADDARGAAARALGMIGDDRAVDPLCASLVQQLSAEGLSSASEERRLGAAWGLGKLGDSRAIGPLCEALSDKRVAVRKASLQALSEILLRSAHNARPENLKRVAELKTIAIGMESDGEGFFGGWIYTDCDHVKQLARQELARRSLLK